MIVVLDDVKERVLGPIVIHNPSVSDGASGWLCEFLKVNDGGVVFIFIPRVFVYENIGRFTLKAIDRDWVHCPGFSILVELRGSEDEANGDQNEGEHEVNYHRLWLPHLHQESLLHDHVRVQPEVSRLGLVSNGEVVQNFIFRLFFVSLFSSLVFAVLFHASFIARLAGVVDLDHLLLFLFSSLLNFFTMSNLQEYFLQSGYSDPVGVDTKIIQVLVEFLEERLELART